MLAHMPSSPPVQPLSAGAPFLSPAEWSVIIAMIGANMDGPLDLPRFLSIQLSALAASWGVLPKQCQVSGGG